MFKTGDRVRINPTAGYIFGYSDSELRNIKAAGCIGYLGNPLSSGNGFVFKELRGDSSGGWCIGVKWPGILPLEYTINKLGNFPRKEVRS